MRNDKNVFDTPLDFFNPDKHPPFPLLRVINHPWVDELDVWVKAMYWGPFLNGKSITAYNMLCAAGQKVDLRETVVVAYSSGNFLTALVGMAPYSGVADVQAILPRDLAPLKLDQLVLFGVGDPIFAPVNRRQVLKLGLDPKRICFDAEGNASGIELARLMGERPNWLTFDQYSDPANAEAHEKWTARQIWEQLDHEVDIVCAGLGTGGTVVGLRKFFGANSPMTIIVGIGLAADEAIPGLRTEKRLAEVGFDWRRAIDEYVEVKANESFVDSLNLSWRAGVMGGPSTGSALAGFFRFYAKSRRSGSRFGNLHRTDNHERKVRAVVVGMDTALLYPEKYSRDLSDKQLMPSDF